MLTAVGLKKKTTFWAENWCSKHVLGQEVCPASKQLPKSAKWKITPTYPVWCKQSQSWRCWKWWPRRRPLVGQVQWAVNCSTSVCPTFNCKISMTTSSETLYHLLPFWKSARKCVFVTDHPKILSGIYPATSSDRSPFNKIFCRFCASFDFQPGSRIATFSGDPQYEESTCYMTAEQSKPEGLGTLILAPNSIHFTEVCITCTSFFAPNFFSLRVGFCS